MTAGGSGRAGGEVSLKASVIVMLLAVGVCTCGCGYALAGRGSFLPESIKTIGVPDFTNATSFYAVDQVLTAKVRTEFIGRGKYKVVPRADGVDAVLLGTITSIGVAPESFNQQQQASRYIVTVTARIEFRETRTDKVLWQNPALVFRESYEVASGGTSFTDPATFFGQEANALERVGNDFARSVVSAILEAF
jgi:hypothetical protein